MYEKRPNHPTTLITYTTWRIKLLRMNYLLRKNQRVQDLGLTLDYKESYEIHTLVEMCASLASLKKNVVCDGWFRINNINLIT